MKNVVFVCIYLQDMNEFSNVNVVYKRYFGLGPPSRFTFFQGSSYFPEPVSKYHFQNAKL